MNESHFNFHYFDYRQSKSCDIRRRNAGWNLCEGIGAWRIRSNIAKHLLDNRPRNRHRRLGRQSN